jgi:DNA-binding XRE family transcriptional regulator
MGDDETGLARKYWQPARCGGAPSNVSFPPELAKAGISKTGLINIENGSSDPKASTLVAITKAVEAAGVEFTNGDQPGVRLRKQHGPASITAEDLNASNDE